MEACSSAPSEVEASKSVEVSLLASPGKRTVEYLGVAKEYYVEHDNIQ